MTFFIYDPSKIFDPSTYLFYKASSLGDLLNFSVVATAAALMYLKKKNPDMDLSKVSVLLFSLIFFMGLFCYGSSQKINGNGGETLEGLHIPQFRDYNEVLSID
jgi:hypothetical protein